MTAKVLFTVQTAKNVTALRIENDMGDTVYNGSYTADSEQSGEIIANSNMLVWKSACTLDSAYSGGFTAYATRKNGSELPEGMRSAETVSIATPKPQLPAMQGFTCDTAISAVPAHLTFTITTSTQVSAVRVVDDSNVALATLYDTDGSDADASMTEEGDIRIWTLAADVESDYVGAYMAQYLLEEGSFSFTPSGYSVQVQLGNEPTPLVTEVPAAESTPEPTVEPTATPVPTPEPTATPEPTPEPTATPEPTNAPLPQLSAEASEAAAPSAIGLKATVYNNGKTASSLRRESSFTSASGAFGPFDSSAFETITVNSMPARSRISLRFTEDEAKTKRAISRYSRSGSASASARSPHTCRPASSAPSSRVPHTLSCSLRSIPGYRPRGAA